MNAEDRSKMNTKYAFAVGALSRDDLEGMASDLSISYDKHTTSDSLRSDVLASLDKQGEPCVKVEYDCAYTGGDYDGVGTFTYIPLSLICDRLHC